MYTDIPKNLQKASKINEFSKIPGQKGTIQKTNLITIHQQ